MDILPDGVRGVRRSVLLDIHHSPRDATKVPPWPKNRRTSFTRERCRRSELFAKLPIARVDREPFLSKQFADSPHLEVILERGPKAVYTVNSLREKE